jgi:hypothetical protein
LLYIEAIVSKIIYGNRPAVIGTIVDITDRAEEEKRIGKAVNDARKKKGCRSGWNFMITLNRSWQLL